MASKKQIEEVKRIMSFEERYNRILLYNQGRRDF